VPSWFNYDQPIEKSRAHDAKPVRGDFGILAARVIAPGDPYRSTLFYRINTEGSGRMPHIGSRLVDEAGVRLLRDWIHSLPAKDSADDDVIAARKLEEENAALLARWRGDTRRNDIAKLLSSMNGCLALLGEATDPALRRDAGAAVSAHTNVMVRDLFQRLLPPDLRRRTLGSDFNPQTVLALSGNATLGRDLFLGMSQCSRCHVCNGAGRAFGPDLTGIGRKYTRAVLLEQILFPSKVVAPEHKTTTVTLLDDTELNGFVLRRTTSEIVLRDETLTERTLKLSALKETRESTLSAMPEGLLAPLTAQEAADLLEYLCAQNSPAP